VETVLHDRSGGSFDNLNLGNVSVGTVDATGTWRLVVRDRDAQDVGTLDRWSLTLN
jgi:subtilisin-like proprotein convertase family protein